MASVTQAAPAPVPPATGEAANDNAHAANDNARNLAQSTSLTPSEREFRKTRQQKAEDIIYTLNHAITCLSITDLLIAPWVGYLSQSWFGKRVDICGHDHSADGHDHHDHDDHHDHHEHDHHEHHDHDHHHAAKNPLRGFIEDVKNLPTTLKEMTWNKFIKGAGNWIIGEFIGDVFAVPTTIVVQRIAPGFMDGMRRILEPVVGGLFRSGAERSARHWADKNGLAADAPEVVARAEELYRYEIQHLPQMLVWTASSVGINYVTMKTINRDLNMGTFIKGKSLGAGTTAGLVFGARALSPGTAHGWDSTVGKHVIAPATKKVSGLFGIRGTDVDDFYKHRDDEASPSWSNRVRDSAPESSISNSK
jgi:hypothetical protein